MNKWERGKTIPYSRIPTDKCKKNDENTKFYH